MASVTSRGLFKAGAKVELVPRVGLHRSSQPAVKSKQVGKDSSVTFDGLNEGEGYWIRGEQPDGEVRSVAVEAKGDQKLSHSLAATRFATAERHEVAARAAAKQHADAVKKDPLAASPAPGKTVESNVVEGQRTTLNRRDEPQPKPRQEDARGPQRSDTITGEAVPKDPKEPVPSPRQEDVPKSTPQRSDTETGEAAIKDPKEQVPHAKQEDVPSSTPQRSATEFGQAEPKPKVSPLEDQKREDSAASKARGRSPEKTEESVRPKGTVTRTTRTGTKARKPSKSKPSSKSRSRKR